MELANIGLAGVKHAESRLDQTAKRIARAPDPGSRPTDAVDIIEAVNTYTANLRLIQTADEIEKHTLNLLG
ncbi:MAG: hypothetical protein FJW39_16580 [Acidobacteria bacterium]|nr:hypothetical protein [Acidobacteriota bacterium]